MSRGCLVTIAIGIAGSVVGGFLGEQLGLYEPGEPVGFFMALLGLEA